MRLISCAASKATPAAVSVKQVHAAIFSAHNYCHHNTRAHTNQHLKLAYIVNTVDTLLHDIPARGPCTTKGVRFFGMHDSYTVRMASGTQHGSYKFIQSGFTPLPHYTSP